MLYNGEEVGNGDGPDCDFAVDPVDGTTLMSEGMPNAISVLAVAERGAMFDPSAVFYMNKIAGGPDVRGLHRHHLADRGQHPAHREGPQGVGLDITVCILDRPRHAKLMAEVREAGARIRLISDGDVVGAISACRPDSGTDLLAGIGGTPRHHHRRGDPAAWAADPGHLAPPTTQERQKAIDRGHDLDRVLTTRIWSPARTSSSAPPASPTATCSRASATSAAAAPPVDRDAFEVRHGPDDRRLPPAVQTQRVLRGGLHRGYHGRVSTSVRKAIDDRQCCW